MLIEKEDREYIEIKGTIKNPRIERGEEFYEVKQAFMCEL
jgi:hypothetical protein